MLANHYLVWPQRIVEASRSSSPQRHHDEVPGLWSSSALTDVNDTPECRGQDGAERRLGAASWPWWPRARQSLPVNGNRKAAPAARVTAVPPGKTAADPGTLRPASSALGKSSSAHASSATHSGSGALVVTA
jgi:hypothetical protein